MAKDHDTARPASIIRGGYTVRFASSDADIRAAQRLRHLCFVEATGLPAAANGRDEDRFDALCDHVLVEDANGTLAGCYRVLAFASGATISTGYAAQFYDLSRLSDYPDPLVEMGRFCIHPDKQNADVLRLAWGMLAAFVDARGAKMLFGCSSFAGTDPKPYKDALDLLAARHQAPDDWAPRSRACDVVRYAADATPLIDHKTALSQLPSLLKTYLSMGGWVSDHAVIDRTMNTLHVFTGLEIVKIPPARAAALRSVAG